MGSPWHKKDPSLLCELREDLERRYPDLLLSVEGDLVRLRGSFPVIDDGAELDRFYIEVTIPAEFPRKIPVVRELAGRVPRSPDWHTFDAGTLCVIVPEEWLANPDSGSILAFLDGPVRNYFIGHALAECGRQRPMGERPHGRAGLLEAYGELIGISDAAAIEKCLSYLARDRVKGHWDCYCGSGKRLRHCHMTQIIELQKRVPPSVAAMGLERLRKYTK